MDGITPIPFGVSEDLSIKFLEELVLEEAEHRNLR